MKTNERYKICLKQNVQTDIGVNCYALHSDYIDFEKEKYLHLTNAQNSIEHWIPYDMIGFIEDRGEAA